MLNSIILFHIEDYNKMLKTKQKSSTSETKRPSKENNANYRLKESPIYTAKLHTTINIR